MEIKIEPEASSIPSTEMAIAVAVGETSAKVETLEEKHEEEKQEIQDIKTELENKEMYHQWLQDDVTNLWSKISAIETTIAEIAEIAKGIVVKEEKTETEGVETPAGETAAVIEPETEPATEPEKREPEKETPKTEKKKSRYFW